jgi:lipid II:glycine glycyltransferase (peptidoglycan interpeptide bridge formation enzyme)
MNEKQSRRIIDAIETSYSNCKNNSFNGKNYFIPLILIKSRLFGKKNVSLPFVDVGGAFGEISEKKIKNLLENKGKETPIFIKLNNYDKNFKKLSKFLTNEGFLEKKEKHQYLIELKEEEEMWKSFHKHTRNDIRKAKKSDLKLKKINSKKELKKFYNIYFREMSRFGTPCHSYRFFKNIMEIWGEDFLGFNCYKGEKAIASILSVSSDNESYLWFNVSTPKFRNMRPNDLLYWELIKILIDKGIKILDLGQIDLDKDRGRSRGLNKFKQKWLGRAYEKYNFAWRVSTGDYEKKENLKKFRILWSKIPSRISRLIGPFIISRLGI